MDTQKQLNSNYTITNSRDFVDDEEDVALPGFRFHPLDEELVGFYLLRKVKKKPISIELIKEIDIYKYDPWDLPKYSNGGEKEWYFFCRRGRKYRNSIRPNRVTGSGSGFWKATGIDRPIYNSDGTICIGLKKSLVYYRGSAGKGTKTEWMMHEFRLPPCYDNCNNKQMDDKSLAHEAEVWTLCRILKRSPCYKKTLPEWREVPTRKSQPVTDTSSGDSDYDMQSYISFQTPTINDNKPFSQNHNNNNHNHSHNNNNNNNQQRLQQQQQQHRHVTSQMIIGQSVMPSLVTSEPLTSSCSSFSGLDVNEFIMHGDYWGDLRSVVDQFSVGDPFFFME